MTRIAICDTRHFEVTYTLLSLFDREGVQVTVFIHAEAFEQVRYLLSEKINRFTWIIKSDQESNRAFISRMFGLIRTGSFDLLYLNTIADNFIIYAYHIKRVKIDKIVMTLHDINGSFRYKPSFSIRRMVRYTGKRMLIRILPAFNVLSENLAVYLQSKLAPGRIVYNLPGGLFKPATFIKRQYHPPETLNIVVPGSVDSRRRNYEAVFELLDALKDHRLPVSIRLCGSFSHSFGREIKQRCLAYNSRAGNLFFYSGDIVPQGEFDRALFESHFVWMPLRPSVTINDGIREEYGTSICSGNIGDVIRYARPFFAPASLAVDAALQQSRLPYKEVSDIVQLLLSLSPPGYNYLQEKALEASLYYTREKIIERNRPLFL